MFNVNVIFVGFKIILSTLSMFCQCFVCQNRPQIGCQAEGIIMSNLGFVYLKSIYWYRNTIVLKCRSGLFCSILTLRILHSENTFAGLCIGINLTKEFPRNPTGIQSEHTEQYSKIKRQSMISAVLHASLMSFLSSIKRVTVPILRQVYFTLVLCCDHYKV